MWCCCTMALAVESRIPTRDLRRWQSFSWRDREERTRELPEWWETGKVKDFDGYRDSYRSGYRDGCRDSDCVEFPRTNISRYEGGHKSRTNSKSSGKDSKRYQVKFVKHPHCWGFQSGDRDTTVAPSRPLPRCRISSASNPSIRS